MKMGQPAEVNQADRLATRTLAAAIVASVANDEEMPLGLIEYSLSDLGPDPAFARADVESLVMQLAQEVCELAKEKDEAVRLLVKATHGGDITRDDTRRVSALMKATGVEP
jgi:hypothetical protein